MDNLSKVAIDRIPLHGKPLELSEVKGVCKKIFLLYFLDENQKLFPILVPNSAIYDFLPYKDSSILNISVFRYKSGKSQRFCLEKILTNTL